MAAARTPTPAPSEEARHSGDVPAASENRLSVRPEDDQPVVEEVTPDAAATTLTTATANLSSPGNFAIAIVADADETYDENDSAIGSDSQSYTTSLASSVFNYKYENGRRYHAYREGEYLLPNDEQEQGRLDLIHHIFKLAIGGELTRTPLSKPMRALDLGTGTGNWAIDFADQYPCAEVTGVDLSPIQSSWVPPNCKFIIDDVESDWPYHENEAFDYIHTRTLCGGIKDWDRLSKQAYDHMKPGGWVEYQEYEAWCKSDDESMSFCPSVELWQQQIDDASTKFGKKMNIAETLLGKLIEAGFQNVHDDPYKVPIGPWPKDPRLKEIGRVMQTQMLEAVEPLAIAFFTRILGHSYERAQVLMAGVRSEFRDPKNHLYAVYHYVYGQKPPIA